MRWAQNVVLVTIAFAALWIVSVLYGDILPATPDQSWAALNVPLAFNGAFAIIHMGAALLFLLTLRIYKAKLKPAYVLIALGITILALGTLQIPLFGAFGGLDSVWVTRGGIGLTFLLSGIFVYAGCRRLAKIVKLKSPLALYKVVVPATLGLCIVEIALPHAQTDLPAIAAVISSAINIGTGGFILAAGLLAWRIMLNMGAHYHNSMYSLGAGFFVSAAIMVCVETEMRLGIDIGSNAAFLILASTAGLLYLYAGYVFSKTEKY